MRTRSPCTLIVSFLLLPACGGTQSVADTTEAPACSAADTGACNLEGMSSFLEAKVKGGSTRAALAPFRRSCDGGDWFGCAMAGAVERDAGQDAGELATRASTLAQKACAEDLDLGACVFMGDWAVLAGDEVGAATHYRRACVLAMDAAKGLDDYSCVKAVELGAARDELAAARDVRAAADAAGTSKVTIARRTSGEKNIVPAAFVNEQACQRGLTRLTSQVVLCLSDEGTPTTIYFAKYSGAGGWDRRIFETMRSWRYTPYTVDGAAKPVCTEVTFVYQPRCK